ncbi:leucine-rich repeat domain-containing protein [Gimesia panareensis]|uniref:hypothetical protein n=1 Tax=Gimesia panareensis TaxID=2527978 RepID=UPI001188E106|nr:hypothetical protein [Gimesia panareensis]QDU52024.1 Leucine Rich repeats (2 copies) [Gimesia panareensis]
MKRLGQLKWFLLLAVLSGGVALWFYFSIDPLARAKKNLRAKGYYVNQVYRSNPLDQSLINIKSFLKREELSVSYTKPHQKRETLEVAAELNTLAPYIEKLNCGMTKIGDQDALLIGKMHQLRQLQLYGPQLTNRGVAGLSNLKNLEWLELYAPQATDEGLNWLQQCHQLSWLFLTDARIGTPTLRQIASHRKLTRLNLQGTRVKSSDLQYLTGLPRLHMLELNRTLINERAAPHLIQMKSLAVLYLSETAAGDQVCQALTYLPQLTELKLDDTLITNQGVQAILEECFELENLSLKRCDVSAHAFIQAQIWPARLKYLSISGTGITGPELLDLIKKHPSLEMVVYDFRKADPEIVNQIESILVKRSQYNSQGK